MPIAALKICCQPGCNEKVKKGYCDTHQKHKSKQKELYRETSHQRGYTHRWSKASKAFLLANPLCTECKRNGDLTPSTETDHIIPHKGDMDLFWDTSNWQALCKPCHSRKTINESR